MFPKLLLKLINNKIPKIKDTKKLAITKIKFHHKPACKTELYVINIFCGFIKKDLQYNNLILLQSDNNKK
ncbi:hypothetical protein P344_04840 [Spiroplasma mirum ATCC 29335]|uniref:Uncharacterized protein n=1 Tax=Spiroplasma mirum ATCC 29335 TaxID=838561 RepID=W6ANK1_9MOLU|nr:hypothetical protein P344_04840 [Spiroplasma mirum ATCC 29335]